MDQGAVALTIISKFFQQPINLETLRYTLSKGEKEKFSALDIVNEAKEVSINGKINESLQFDLLSNEMEYFGAENEE